VTTFACKVSQLRFYSGALIKGGGQWALTSHVVTAATLENLDVALRTRACGFGRCSFGLLSSAACDGQVLFTTLATMERDIAG